MHLPSKAKLIQKITAGLLCLALLLAPATLWAGEASSASNPEEPSSSTAGESQSTPEETPQENTEDPDSPVRPAAEGSAWLYEPTAFTPEAPGVCLISEDSGLMVYGKDPHTSFTSASLVKMMTCILVAEKATDLDAETVTAEGWISDELYGKNASHADIRTGETLSLRELLYAALLPSGNEAALMLASHISGGYLANFLYMMNYKAEELGCTGTTFTDPNGLSEDNRTTAYDMCLITREFMKHPALTDIAAQATYEMQPHEQHAEAYLIHNTNRLLVETSPYYSAFSGSAGTVQGGKTGTLGDWQNFAGYAEKEGARYIVAVLESPADADETGKNINPPQSRPALYEAAQLLDWAFENLSVRAALDTTQPITEVPVRYSSEVDTIKLLPSTDMQALLPTDAADSEIQRDFDVPEYVSAPVEEGDLLGSVTLALEGHVIGTAQLRAAHGAQRNNTLYTVRKVQEFFGSTYFKVVLGIVAVVAVLYFGMVLLIGYLAEQKKQKQKNRKKRGK